MSQFSKPIFFERAELVPLWHEAPTMSEGIDLEAVARDVLLPESVRFESEPWTSFYIAGEIIRESRKTLENKKVNVLSLQRKVT